MERIPKPSRIIAFWRTFLGVHPSPVLVAVGKTILGLIAIPIVLPLALICTLVWLFYLLGNKITKSTIALIESRYVE